MDKKKIIMCSLITFIFLISILIFNTKNKKILYIDVCKDCDRYSKLVALESKDDNFSNIKGIYICKSKKCESEISDDDKHLLIFDNEYIVYNYKTKEKIKTGIKTKRNMSKGEEVNSVFIDDKVIGFTIGHNNKTSYYSLKDKKVLYEVEGNIEIYNYTTNTSYEKYIKDDYFVNSYGNKNEDNYYCKSSLINIKNGKKINNTEINGIYYYDEELNYNALIDYCNNNSKNLIENNKLVFDKNYTYLKKYNDRIYAFNINDNYYMEYNLKTKEKIKREIYNKILDIYENYILINKNNNIVVTDYNNKEIKIIDKLDNNTTYLIDNSGYIEAHDNNKAGIYFKFEKEDDVCYKYYYDYKNNESKKIEYECGQM